MNNRKNYFLFFFSIITMMTINAMEDLSLPDNPLSLSDNNVNIQLPKNTRNYLRIDFMLQRDKEMQHAFAAMKDKDLCNHLRQAYDELIDCLSIYTEEKKLRHAVKNLENDIDYYLIMTDLFLLQTRQN